MAKALWGLPISEVRGHVAGTTFQRTQYGACIQNKVSQKFRRSASQSSVRQGIKQASGAWSSLTQAQRNSFLSNNYQGITGFNLFQFINARRPRYGLPFVTTFPVPPSMLTEDYRIVQLSYNPNGGYYVFYSRFFFTSDLPEDSWYAHFTFAYPTSAGIDVSISDATTNVYALESFSDSVFYISIYSQSAAADGRKDLKWIPQSTVKAWITLFDKETGLPLTPQLFVEAQVPPIYDIYTTPVSSSIAWNATGMEYITSVVAEWQGRPTLNETSVRAAYAITDAAAPPPDASEYSDFVGAENQIHVHPLTFDVQLNVYNPTPHPSPGQYIWIKWHLVQDVTHEQISNDLVVVHQAPTH